MVFDGLTSSFDGLHMVQQASQVARELEISREDQDAWAYRSHQRAAGAQDEGRFDDEIVAVGDVTADESIRRDTTLEKLAALKPVFDPEGTTTAGNAPGVNDGASCVVVVLRGVGARHGESSRSRRSSRRDTSPTTSRTSRARPPAPARSRSRRRARRSTTSRASRSTRRSRRSRGTRRCMLGADEEIVNVNGGAVALGHPIGASGGRIVATMVHELRRNGGGLGLAAICSGGGQGDALLLEV